MGNWCSYQVRSAAKAGSPETSQQLTKPFRVRLQRILFQHDLPIVSDQLRRWAGEQGRDAADGGGVELAIQMTQVHSLRDEIARDLGDVAPDDEFAAQPTLHERVAEALQ